MTMRSSSAGCIVCGRDWSRAGPSAYRVAEKISRRTPACSWRALSAWKATVRPVISAAITAAVATAATL